MKKLFLIVLLFVSKLLMAQAAIDCNDPNLLSCCPSLASYTPKMKLYEDLGCKTDRKAAEYPFFPKMLEYQGYIFRDISSCAAQNMDCSLMFDYCVPQTRETMRVKITDYKDPFFATNQGKAALNMDFLVLNPQALALGSHELSPMNRKYKKSRIVSARFSPYGGKSDDVMYYAFVNDRYMITITLTDKVNRFKSALETERFLNSYIEQINLKETY